MLDWMRHPVGRRPAKRRESSNLFVLANKKEARDASNRSWPPLCKGASAATRAEAAEGGYAVLSTRGPSLALRRARLR